MFSKKSENLDDAMRTLILTPNSSVKSSTTMASTPSQTRDSFYFPDCKKDTNCNCEICIASINATLDLMPLSVHRSSLTKLSVSKPKIHRSPVSFASSADFSTPKSSNRVRPVTGNSSAGLEFQEKIKRDKGEIGYGVLVVRFLLSLILVYGLENGFILMASGFLKSRLSPEIITDLAVKSLVHEGLNGRFMFLNNELESFVGNKVSSCNSADSVWKISQDTLLLNSRCMLYESMTEEVSIWGWPLQTAGLLTAEYSSRSLNVISGRVTEWSTGEPNHLLHTANSSWTQVRWSSSVVQFDPNTWILEYRQSFLLENMKPISATLNFLKFRLTREFEKMKREFWMPSAFLRRSSSSSGWSILTPT